MRLTFRNALKFNPVGHPINSAARLLLLDFESCLVDLLSEYVGAIPKAENIDKYLDSYPIADLIPMPPISAQPVDPVLDNQDKPIIAGSKIPPLELHPVESSVHRGRGRRKIVRGRQSGAEARGAITSLEGVPEDGDGTVGNHIPVYSDDVDQMATPQLCRADSMDSMQSCNSVANENCSIGDDNDNWTPRLLFAPIAISGPIPRPAIQGIEAERKAFEKPCLGFKGAMALMSEISKSVFRLKDDLFVIKFTPPLRSKDKSLKKRTVSAQSLCDEFDDGSGILVSDPSPYHLGTKDGMLDTEVITSCSSLTEKVKGDFFSEPMSVSETYSEVVIAAESGVRDVKEGVDLVATMELNAENSDPDAAVAINISVELNVSIMRAEDEGMEMSEGDGSTTLTESFVSLIQDRSVPLQSIPLDDSYWAADKPLDPVDAYLSPPPLTVVSNVSYTQNGDDKIAVAPLPGVVPPFVPPPILPPKRGRRGREAGTGRSSHQKKSRGARGRNRAKANVPVSIISAVSGSIAAAQLPATDISVAAAIAIKTKGGKAGAYLRRLGERDQREEGEVDCEEEFSPYCLSLLADLVPDTTDPDPPVKCPFVDSRHTFLEMCQFRHYQFDSLRRAKHSSLMLLYHLHYPNNVNARPTCACCKGAIRDVRWHCDQCADFDVCDSCYQAAESEIKLDPVDCNLIPLLPKKDKDGNFKREQATSSAPAPVARLDKHSHPLTPFRITYI